MAERPTGTVTFLFTDIEGSTRLLQQLGTAYRELLADHHRLIREAVAACGGVEISTEGDAFFVVFRAAPDAVQAAAKAQHSLAAQRWPQGVQLRVRMGIHAGEATLSNGDYVGLDIHRAARIASAAHGGQVLVSDPVRQLTIGALPDDVTLRDLGEHRLKDLDRAEHLYQLIIAGLDANFPPIRSISARFEQLPAEVTTFIGREREVERARALLATTRLLTLTGPGGTGKTRLSMQVARRSEADFGDGAVFVPLAPLSDAQLVASTIRHVLGFKEVVGRTSVEAIVDGIADRQMLLVLDNFEQVLPAADTVARLLAGTRSLKIIVTSRAPLHIAGEQEMPVPPLALPVAGSELDLAALLESEAVALFVLRARAVRADFTLTTANAPAIIEICVRLDGLPLAIELAASRVKLLPPEALLSRLGHRLDLLQSSSADRTDRQRTLRGAIDWSHDLLDADSRALFRRLAVFVGGWDLEDAEAVVPAAGRLPLDLLDGLEALVDHSLVRQDAAAGEPRFGMLETIHEYGLEQLAASPDQLATARAHAVRFLELAVRLGPSFTAAGAALDQAAVENDNIRAALRWALDHQETELALSASGALWRFWHLRGHLREGQRLTSEALALPDAEADTLGRARALYGLGSLRYWMGDYAGSKAAYDRSLAVARNIGAESSEAETLYALGFLYGIDKDHDAAHAAFLQSRAIGERLGDRLAIANALFGAGFTEWLAGRNEHALEEILEVLPIFEELGDRYSLINAYGTLGRVLEDLGRVEEGRAYHLRVLEGSLEIGDRSQVAMALLDIASLEAQRGNFELALRLDGASHVVTERLGGSAPSELVRTVDPQRLAREADVPESRIKALVEEGRALSDDELVPLAKDGLIPA